MIAVLGDPMLDEWVELERTRANPEAPSTPVVRRARKTVQPGGALNLAANLVRATNRLVHFIPSWHWANAAVCGLMTDYRVMVAAQDFLGSGVTHKRRVLLDGTLLYREDRDVRPDPSRVADEREIAQRLAFDAPEMIVVNDYDKGSITVPVARAAVARSQKAALSWCVLDVKPRLAFALGQEGFSPYRLIVKMNEAEAAMIVGKQPSATALRAAVGTDWAVVTRGAEGASFAGPRFTSEAFVTPGPRLVEAARRGSIAGAGDVFTALLCAALLSGDPMHDAVLHAVTGTTDLIARCRQTLLLPPCAPR